MAKAFDGRKAKDRKSDMKKKIDSKKDTRRD